MTIRCARFLKIASKYFRSFLSRNIKARITKNLPNFDTDLKNIFFEFDAKIAFLPSFFFYKLLEYSNFILRIFYFVPIPSIRISIFFMEHPSVFFQNKLKNCYSLLFDVFYHIKMDYFCVIVLSKKLKKVKNFVFFKRRKTIFLCHFLCGKIIREWNT